MGERKESSNDFFLSVLCVQLTTGLRPLLSLLVVRECVCVCDWICQRVTKVNQGRIHFPPHHRKPETMERDSAPYFLFLSGL